MVASTKINKAITELDELIARMAGGQSTTSKALFDLREERCRSYRNEVAGWVNLLKSRGTSQETKTRFYCSADEQKALVEQSCVMIRDCDTAGSVLDKVVRLTLGEKVTYESCVRRFSRDEFDSNDQLRANKLALDRFIDRLTDDGSPFRYVEEEMVRRYHRDGDVYRIADSQDDNPYKMQFIEVCLVCKPDVESPKDDEGQDEFDLWRWSFGVVARADRPNITIGYWVKGMSGDMLDSQEEIFDEVISTNFGLIRSEDISHCKANVDINDPKGVPTNHGSWETFMQLHETTSSMVTMLLVQARHAAIYKFSSGVSNGDIQGLVNNLKKTLDGWGKDKEQEREGPGIHFAKNKEVELPTVAPIDSFLSAIRFIKHQIGQSFRGLPGFMVTGDTDSGNRSNFEEILKPFIAALCSDQRKFGSENVSLIWQCFESEGEISPSDIEELRRHVKIEAKFTKLSFESALDLAKCHIQLVGADLLSKRSSMLMRGIEDPDKETLQILAENDAEFVGDTLSLQDDEQ